MKYPSIKRDNIDFQNDTEICNIGYNDGKLTDGRPYRLEVWTSYGITNATIFISTKGLENVDDKTLKKMLIADNIIDVIKDDIFITDVEDSSGNAFYSINVPLESNYTVINKLLIKKLKEFNY